MGEFPSIPRNVYNMEPVEKRKIRSLLGNSRVEEPMKILCVGKVDTIQYLIFCECSYFHLLY